MKRKFIPITSTSLVLSLCCLTFICEATLVAHSTNARLEEKKKETQGIGASALSRSEELKTDEYNLSISIDKTIFTLNEEANIRAKIENTSGQNVKPDDLRYVKFNLSKYGKDVMKHRTSELYTSRLSLRNSKLAGHEAVEFEVDLTNLTWADALSSNLEASNVRNMFDVIPSGNYYLFVELKIPAANSTKEYPRVISIKSNEILVKIEGK